jgi:hypothetical protein
VADAELEAGVDELRRRLVGHRFPGGRFRVAEYERWLSHDAMQAGELAPPALHPVWILLGALRGMGISIEDLIELADATPQDGVVFGETSVDQLRPLQQDVEYTVRGEIVDLRRKRGRRGLFDLLTFELHLEDGTEPVAVNSQTFVFPRAEVPGAL